MDQNQATDELKFTSAFNPSGVIMLDGLKRADNREKQTGIKIFDELRDLNGARGEKQILLERHTVATAEALRKELRRFAREFPEDFGFILHLECHGGTNGIEIGDRREQMPWKEFLALLTPINRKNNCNVGLVLACCHGYGSFKVDDLADPAPFYCQLSNQGEIKAGNLEACLIAFYQTILTSHDISAAIKAAAPFKMKYAEEIFVDLMYRVFHQEPRGKSSKQHVNTVLSGLLARGGLGGNMDVTHNRKIVKENAGTFEQQIAQCIQSHISFFCGREPAFEVQQLVKWIAAGKTLV